MIWQIVPAACFERVDHLFGTVGFERWGEFDPESGRVRAHEERHSDDEDLLDLAAVHTLSNGATVYAVQPNEVPGDTMVAAILRY